MTLVGRNQAWVCSEDGNIGSNEENIDTYTFILSSHQLFQMKIVEELLLFDLTSSKFPPAPGEE